MPVPTPWFARSFGMQEFRLNPVGSGGYKCAVKYIYGTWSVSRCCASALVARTDSAPVLRPVGGVGEGI